MWQPVARLLGLRPVGLQQSRPDAHQQLRGLEPTVLGGQVEWRLPAAVGHAGVTAVLQQKPDHGRVTVLAGRVQRRLVVLVLWGGGGREGVRGCRVDDKTSPLECWGFFRRGMREGFSQRWQR